MGVYFDDVYTIQNGKWRLIAAGRYEGFTDGYDEANHRYICEDYLWNNREVTRETYMYSLKNIYDLDHAAEADLTMSRGAMLSVLNNTY